MAKYGQTSRGVDWNSEEGQLLRFEQLSKVIDSSNQFSVNDLGCGYGAFYEFLVKKYGTLFYSGIDISETMIQGAQQRYQEEPQAQFIISSQPNQILDYSITSGIFNVRFNRSDTEWLEYIKSTLDVLHQTSRLGFAFNCLTSYSDKEKMQPSLYYADPCILFDLCKSQYSRHVSLLHDYGLYEFTILVKKTL